jgi:hypothetical protein
MLRVREAARLWTTVARVAVCIMLAGAAADIAGWKGGIYAFAAAFFALMLSLRYP